MKPFNPAGRLAARSCGGTVERAVTRAADAGGASSAGSTVLRASHLGSTTPRFPSVPSQGRREVVPDHHRAPLPSSPRA